jgi:hypothetical protein
VEQPPDRFFINTGRAWKTTTPSTGKLPITRGKIKSADDVRRWAVCHSLKHHGVVRRRYEAMAGIAGEDFGPKIG